MNIEGGCLCGAVRYRAETVPLRVVVCHCRNCQKQTGTAFSLVVAIPSDALRLQGETVTYIDTGDSGAEVHRHFCGSCGSPLISKIPSRPNVVFIKSGTIDDTRWLVPEAHIWCRSAQPWVHMDPELPRFDGPFGSVP
jgi:hypothetical protein